MSDKILLIADSANPEWVSGPLVGWSLASAIARIADAHLVTQVRNRVAILNAGLVEGRDFTSIDSERVARPIWRLTEALMGKAGGGWTLATALGTVSYYYFESLVWKQFRAALERGEYKLVHRITPQSPSTPSILAKKCNDIGIPFVIGPINGGVPYPKGFEDVQRQEREWLSHLRSAYKLLPAYKSTLKSSRALIVASRITLQEIPAIYHDKCFYLPENAVDPHRFSEMAKPLQDGCVRACFVGRLVPLKGLDMLLDAAVPLLRSGRLKLDVIGDGPLRNTLTQMLTKEELSQHVTLHGWIDHRNLQHLMCESQLLILPSIREFGGGVVLEAMALGIVPVVVDYAGPGELVTSETGIKVPIGRRPELVANLREALVAICDDPGRISTLSRNARSYARTYFTWDAKAGQIMQIYDWILGRRRDKPSFFTQ